jgi:hypothetical protein
LTIEAHAPVGNELIMAEDCARSSETRWGTKTELYFDVPLQFRRTGSLVLPSSIVRIILIKCAEFRASPVTESRFSIKESR